jgi:uncharacterized protein (UPF0210 family)
MKIRSITYFLNPTIPSQDQAIQQAGDFLQAARPALEAAGYEVQTARLATIPFPALLPQLDIDLLIELARSLETAGKSAGYDYISLGPALPGQLESYALIPPVLAATEQVFMAGMLTTPQGGVSLPAVRACAEVIERAASITSDGFGNLYFAALGNVPPGAPFFPAAYHAGDAPSFGLACEAADLAVEAFTAAGSLAEARQSLIERVEHHAHKLTAVSRQLSAMHGLAFGGLDLTPAPFPEKEHSLGTALERLGLPAVGLHGGVAAAAFLAEALDRAELPRAGFNGLMLPVLEDATLAQRAAEGTLTVRDLLLYSTVCGTGLDTVPLPGDTSRDQLAAILLDLAALSQRLDKPLTARLMPIPGKQSGDPTEFDFGYFANSRVLTLEAAPLTGLLAGNETFYLQRRL